MNIYVISNVWAREGSAIVGAAASAELAEEIANRVGAYRWSAWEKHGGTKERTAMLADGTTWPKLRQEIVCVPLAGYIGDWPIIKPIDETGPALLREVPALTVGRQVIENIRVFTTGRD